MQNAETGTSGAEKIGSAAVQNLEMGGVYPLSIRGQIELLTARLYEALNQGVNISEIIEEGDIKELMIDNNAITTEKIMDGAVTASKIAEGIINGGSLSAGSITTLQLATGVVVTEKISDDAITETKIGSGAVSKIKLHPETLALIPSLNEGIGMISSGQSLDAYVTVGTYVCFSDAIAAGLTNCPAMLAFKLFVDYTRGQSDYLVQICRDRTGNQFVRSKAPNESWTSWVSQANIVYGTDSVPPAGTYPAGTLYIQYQA